MILYSPGNYTVIHGTRKKQLRNFPPGYCVRIEREQKKGLNHDPKPTAFNHDLKPPI